MNHMYLSVDVKFINIVNHWLLEMKYNKKRKDSSLTLSLKYLPKNLLLLVAVRQTSVTGINFLAGLFTFSFAEYTKLWVSSTYKASLLAKAKLQNLSSAMMHPNCIFLFLSVCNVIYWVKSLLLTAPSIFSGQALVCVCLSKNNLANP